MRKLILHAGRHKTGTTTLQDFLYGNSEFLLQHNYNYPRYGLKGSGHHRIGAALTRANIKSLGVDVVKALDDHRTNLHQVLDTHSSDLIISSEAFQNCDPRVVKDFFSDFDTEVVIYLREEMGYLISSYAQKVQASRYTGSIEEYFESTFKDNYGRFVSGWDREFGDKLQLRVYERGELVGRDIVLDFMSGVLGFDQEKVAAHYQKNNANPTLTRALLEYKRAVNRCAPLREEHARLFFHALSALARSEDSGKLTLPQGLVDRMRHKYEESNTAIARKYFNRDRLFAPFEQNASAELPEITPEHFCQIRASLVELTPELDAALPTL